MCDKSKTNIHWHYLWKAFNQQSCPWTSFQWCLSSKEKEHAADIEPCDKAHQWGSAQRKSSSCVIVFIYLIARFMLHSKLLTRWCNTHYCIAVQPIRADLTTWWISWVLLWSDVVASVLLARGLSRTGYLHVL